MNNEVENYIELLQYLNNPQNQKFEDANKTISQLIMNQDQDFLQAILNLLLNINLETNESFYALSIAKEYFRRSLNFDKFHNTLPHSSYSHELIILFQKAAYRFFVSEQSFLRNNAADLYVQAYKANIMEEVDLIPELIEKLANNFTKFEEILSIMECFCLIFTSLHMCQYEQKIFPIILNLLDKFSDRDEFLSLFFRLIAQFDNHVFSFLSNPAMFINFFETVIRFYQKKINLKVDIINFLQSPSLGAESYCQIISKILPLLYEDLLNITSLPSNIGLSILEFINSDLLIKYPPMIDIFVSQFLPVILNISQLFDLNDDPRFFISDEWDFFNAAQSIIIFLLTTSNLDKNISTIIFFSILPYIQNGLISDDIRHRCVSMNLLSYSLRSIPSEIIEQSISIDLVIQALNQTINSNFCQVRSYWMQLLLSLSLFCGIDIAIQHIDFVFKSVFDCQPISTNAISLLIYIGENKNFTLLDEFFAKICQVLDDQQLFNQSPEISNFFYVLSFAQNHHEFLKPVIEFILTYLNKSLTFSEDIAKNVNRGILHVLCTVLIHLMPLYLEQLSEEEKREIFNLIVSLYNRFLLGTELLLIIILIKKNFDAYENQLNLFANIVHVGFSNIDQVYSFPLFFTFSLFLEMNFDVSRFNLNIIFNLIQFFNASQNIYIKKEVLAALAEITQMKPDLFTYQIIANSLDFFDDLCENVYSIFTAFSDESDIFYEKACSLFKGLIDKTCFRDLPQSFLLTNQLIVHILDYENLADSIFPNLSALFESFYLVYKEPFNDLLNSQEIYKAKYFDLIQKIKEQRMIQSES